MKVKLDADLEEFFVHMEAVLVKRSSEEGYTKGDEGDLLNEFTETFFDGHAMGEIVYKAANYQRTKDEIELVKIASWAFLKWRRERNRGEKPSTTL